MFDYFLNPSLAHLFLRLILGFAFVAHGYPKLFKNFSNFSGWLDSVGIKPGKFWALVVGLSEFFGGLALIAGILVELVSLLIAVDMLVAMWKVKWGKVGFTDNGGWELDLMYLAVAVSLILTGGGLYSFSFY